MAKKSGIGNLILLGGLAIGGYLLYKQFFSGQQQQSGGWTANWIPGDATPQTPLNPDENTPTVTPKPQPPAGSPKVVVETTPGGGSNYTVIPLDTAPITKPLIQYTKLDPVTKAVNTITIPAPLGVTPATVAQPVNTGWTAAIYGQQGQPSVAFLQNTLTTAASNPTMTQQVKTSNTVSTTATAPTPIAAIGAGAPPRVVAKIKAGTWY